VLASWQGLDRCTFRHCVHLLRASTKAEPVHQPASQARCGQQGAEAQSTVQWISLHGGKDLVMATQSG
jgi:hypothetical protein